MSRRSSKKERVVRHTLADGSVRTYRYPAYKPKRAKAAGDTLGDLIAGWESSPELAALAPASHREYLTYLRLLHAMQHVPAPKVERSQIIDIRNALAKVRGPGAANNFVKTASALFNWAVENGRLAVSPTIRMKRLAGGHLPTWTQRDLELALASLPEHLRRAIVLAAYSGQRRGDLCRLPWNAYDGHSLRLRQEKTGAALVIPCHPALKAELDEWRAGATSTMILTKEDGRPWQPSNLSKRLQVALAQIEGFPTHRNVHGLRKLAAMRLAEVGCTLHEIGAITGHRSLAMLQLYTSGADQERLAQSAVLRWARKPE